MQKKQTEPNSKMLRSLRHTSSILLAKKNIDCSDFDNIAYDHTEFHKKAE